MEICNITNIECNHCEQVCDKIITPQKVAIDLLGTVNNLLRAIEYDKNLIDMNIDLIISTAKYFKSVFKY